MVIHYWCHQCINQMPSAKNKETVFLKKSLAGWCDCMNICLHSSISASKDISHCVLQHYDTFAYNVCCNPFSFPWYCKFTLKYSATSNDGVKNSRVVLFVTASLPTFIIVLQSLYNIFYSRFIIFSFKINDNSRNINMIWPSSAT